MPKRMQSLHATACKNRSLPPGKGEGAIRAWALPYPFVDQRMKFLLCLTDLSLILLAQMALHRRILFWDLDTKVSMTISFKVQDQPQHRCSAWLSLCWFLCQKLWTYLPGTGIQGWGAWSGSGTPRSPDIPPKFLSTWVWDQPVPHLCPSYESGRMWFLQFCSCQTSIQLNFWCSWVMAVLYFSCNFDVVVQRRKPCLPKSPSWPEAWDFFKRQFSVTILNGLFPKTTCLGNMK